MSHLMPKVVDERSKYVDIYNCQLFCQSHKNKPTKTAERQILRCIVPFFISFKSSFFNQSQITLIYTILSIMKSVS